MQHKLHARAITKSLICCLTIKYFEKQVILRRFHKLMNHSSKCSCYVFVFQWLMLARKYCFVAEQRAIHHPSLAGVKAPYP